MNALRRDCLRGYTGRSLGVSSAKSHADCGSQGHVDSEGKNVFDSSKDNSYDAFMKMWVPSSHILRIYLRLNLIKYKLIYLMEISREPSIDSVMWLLVITFKRSLMKKCKSGKKKYKLYSLERKGTLGKLI